MLTQTVVDRKSNHGEQQAGRHGDRYGAATVRFGRRDWTSGLIDFSLVNKLERPYGRIALENAKAPGVMIDLGITSPEVGVPVPADGRKLRMVLKDDSGVRTDE